MHHHILTLQNFFWYGLFFFLNCNGVNWVWNIKCTPFHILSYVGPTYYIDIGKWWHQCPGVIGNESSIFLLHGFKALQIYGCCLLLWLEASSKEWWTNTETETEALQWLHLEISHKSFNEKSNFTVYKNQTAHSRWNDSCILIPLHLKTNTIHWVNVFACWRSLHRPTWDDFIIYKWV